LAGNPTSSNEPKWTEVPKLRTIGPGLKNEILERVWKDPDSPHENTHDIDGYVRGWFPGGTGRWNACYVPGGKAAVIAEPRTVRLSAVGRSVPESLRGGGYQLYLVKQVEQWDDAPLYVVEEWAAYMNGLQCAVEERSTDAAYQFDKCHEFLGYSLTALRTIVDNEPTYDATQLDRLIRWQSERLASLEPEVRKIAVRPQTVAAQPFAVRLRHNHDAGPLRRFVRNRFGHPWCGKVLYLQEAD
jgi:hypothetical protein